MYGDDICAMMRGNQLKERSSAPYSFANAAGEQSSSVIKFVFFARVNSSDLNMSEKSSINSPGATKREERTSETALRFHCYQTKLEMLQRTPTSFHQSPNWP